MLNYSTVLFYVFWRRVCVFACCAMLCQSCSWRWHHPVAVILPDLSSAELPEPRDFGVLRTSILRQNRCLFVVPIFVESGAQNSRVCGGSPEFEPMEVMTPLVPCEACRDAPRLLWMREVAGSFGNTLNDQWNGFSDLSFDFG